MKRCPQMVGLRAVGFERDRDHRAAGDRDDGPPEPAEERPSARPARELGPGSLDRPHQPARSSSACIVRRRAVSTRPSTCSSEFTVPGPDDADLVEHHDERNARDAVRGLEIRIGDELKLEPARTGAAAGSDGATCSQIGQVSETNATSRPGPGPPTTVRDPSRVLDRSSLRRLTERRALRRRPRAPRAGRGGAAGPRPGARGDHDDRQQGDQDPQDDEGGRPPSRHAGQPCSRAFGPEDVGDSSGRSSDGENELGAVHSGSPFASRNCITGVPSAVSPMIARARPPCSADAGSATSAASPIRARTLPSSSCNEIVGDPLRERVHETELALLVAERERGRALGAQTELARTLPLRSTIAMLPTRRRTTRTWHGPCPRRRRSPGRPSRRVAPGSARAACRPRRRTT